MSGAARPAAAPAGPGTPTIVLPPGWTLAHLAGAAGAVHARPLAEVPARLVTVVAVDGPALVLGSTQPAADVDPGALARAGVALARRRSGGGAVLLVPGGSLWVDVDLPRDDPLWDEDVGRAFHWLGRAWRDALVSLGEPAEVHEGPLLATAWSRQVCFAGLGPGEVTVGGAKVVGISSRRGRHGARFQCAVLRRWEAGSVTSLLALDPATRAGATRALAGVAAGVDHDPEAVVAALVRHLPPGPGAPEAGTGP